MGNLKSIQQTFLRVRREHRLGDKVEVLTKATGIKAAVELANRGPCTKCEARKVWLNGENV